MFTDRRILYLAIFFIATSNISAFQCPANEKCSCLYYDAGFEIDCPLQNGSFFIVNIQPERYMKIECSLKSPKWSEFPLDVVSLERNAVKAVRIVRCDLPTNNITLGKIVRMLRITGVEKLIFESLKNLNSETLNRHHLDGFDGLKYLILSNNNLSHLDEDLLADLPHLKGLDLRANKLHLPTGFFYHTPELTWLELSENTLQSIQPGTFDNLKRLTLLNLWKNDFVELPSGIFDKLINLRSLDLSMNDMMDLSADVVAKLENLESINLSRNRFVQLPKDLLRNNTKLQIFELIKNRGNITLPNGFFANLTKLETVYLKWNGIIALPEDLFWGSFSLTRIVLARNRLKSLPVHIFRDAKQLTTLELSFNDIEELPDYIFINTSRLIKLDLSENRITAIRTHSFNGLNTIEELNMKNNRLTIIADQSFSYLRRLKIIRLSNNHLTLTSDLSKYSDVYETNSPFYNCISLEELYLANNSISEIFSDWLFSRLKLRKLDLKYNDIPSIYAADLQFMSNNIVVDLTHNKIQHIFLDNVEEIASAQSSARDVIILLEGNPLICDCSIYDLLRYIEGRMHPYVRNYFRITLGNSTCQSPEWLKNMIVTDLKSKSLTCVAKDTNLNVTCPEKCVCTFRPDDRSFIVDCSYRNLTSLPSVIAKPDGAVQVELYFSGNILKQMPNLKQLELQSVRKLDLSHNNISEIFLDGLSITIEVLKLHNNNISRIRSNVLEFLKNSTNLAQLTLSENPWECNCDARDFLNFIQTKFVNISDLLQITCRGKNDSISKMTMNDFCPTETELIVVISITIAVIGLLVGICGLYYRYQTHIKIWLFTNQYCLWFVTEEDLDREKLYDAFVSYSHKDHDFVVNELVSKLENDARPFKLCLHYRDWFAGEWIPTQIAKSVEDSRRTIVVLSPNFLESVWGRMEFRTAHSQALSDGRARIILILYGDIEPINDLDEELKAYLKMNTYIKWGDPWFWNKLKYALPHSPKFARRNSVTVNSVIVSDNCQPSCIKLNKITQVYPILPLDSEDSGRIQ